MKMKWEKDRFILEVIGEESDGKISRVRYWQLFSECSV